MSDSKRQKLEPETVSHSADSNAFCEKNERNLLDISDDVLLNVLHYLSATDLYHLSRTCERLYTLCRDRTLWHVADFRKWRMKADELSGVLELLQSHTKFLAIRGYADFGCCGEAGVLPKEFLACLPVSCPELETFILEDFYIDVDEVDCRDFPRTVKCLSLKGSQVVDSAKVRCLTTEKTHFFLDVYAHLPSLEKLVLSYCRWFRLHSLMAISKCPNLVELKLDGIRHLHDNVPYLSLATSFGFRKLKILDLRNTTVGSSAMRGFNNLLNLTHLYLECPPQYRDTKISDSGPSTSQHCPESSDEDCEEVNLMRGHENSCVIVLRFGGTPEVWHSNTCGNGCHSKEDGDGIRHIRRNSNKDEETSRQKNGSGSSDDTVQSKKDECSVTSNPECCADVGTEAFKVSIDTENAKTDGKDAENNQDLNNRDLNLSNTQNSDKLDLHTEDSNYKKETGIALKEQCAAEAESGGSELVAGTSFQAAENSHAIENISSCNGKPSYDEKLEKFSRCWKNKKYVEIIAEEPVDGGANYDTQLWKPVCACQGGRVLDSSESSDDDASGKQNRRKSASCSMLRKKGRYRPAELLSSIRKGKCGRTPWMADRQEELIDDLSIDYFLSRDMWRVSQDGNIVRCNDRSPQLHTLVLRFYPRVTDKTLTLLLRIASLRYVDVTGTKVTEKGVLWFKLFRPDVTIESDFGPSK